jgi:predicted regulator of Ras-like GTPase activity (Roadblock/LC7/MglB family)
MVPATNSTKPIVPYNVFNLSEKGERESMTTEEILETFKEQTGISIIRASKEGVLKDYNVVTDFPEILGAMLATVYGASVTAITDFTEGEDAVVKIASGDHCIVIVSNSDDILAAIVPNGGEVLEEDLQALAKQLEESE